VRAGLPRPEVQYRIEDEHGFVLARSGLAYPSAKLAIEYDGDTHFSRRREETDRQRDAALAGYGWLTLRLGPDDVGAAPTYQRIDDLLADRSPARHRG
jgi:very-short-patch-repair endonuclease